VKSTIQLGAFTENINHAPTRRCHVCLL